MVEVFDGLSKQQKDELIAKRISEGWEWQETYCLGTADS
jgi:hypothetical protein